MIESADGQPPDVGSDKGAMAKGEAGDFVPKPSEQPPPTGWQQSMDTSALAPRRPMNPALFSSEVIAPLLPLTEGPSAAIAPTSAALSGRLSAGVAAGGVLDLSPGSTAPGSDWEIPASDRFVSLDHNSTQYGDAVAALERVIREFREDHRLENRFGAEKSALLTTLEAGRKLLEDSRVRVASFVTMIINPLKIIWSEYHREIVAGTVTASVTVALELLVKLI